MPHRGRERWVPGASQIGFAAAMGLIISVTAAFVVWIVLWALGWKGQDAALITVAIVVVAAGTKVLSHYLPGRRS